LTPFYKNVSDTKLLETIISRIAFFKQNITKKQEMKLPSVS